jgi:hypothetical protein
MDQVFLCCYSSEAEPIDEEPRADDDGDHVDDENEVGSCDEFPLACSAVEPPDESVPGRAMCGRLAGVSPRRNRNSGGVPSSD